MARIVLSRISSQQTKVLTESNRETYLLVSMTENEEREVHVQDLQY